MLDFLRLVLFESLPWLLGFCALAVAVAVAVHRRRQTRASRRGIWITLAVCVGLVVLQYVVVTDREALEQTVRAMADAVDDGDVDAIAQRVDAGFRWGSEGREQFIQSVNQTLQDYQIDGVHIFSVKVRAEGDTATVSFRGLCDVRRGADGPYSVSSRWELRFVRRSGRWLLEGVDLARYNLLGGPDTDIRPLVR